MEIGVLGHVLAVSLLALLQVALQLLRVHEDQRVASLLDCLLAEDYLALVVVLTMHQRFPAALLSYYLAIREITKTLLIVEDVLAFIRTLYFMAGQ